jgi:hypothetical protein
VDVGTSGSASVPAEDKKAEFASLFSEFARSFPDTPEGRDHIDAYERDRTIARENFLRVVDASERGEDVTDSDGARPRDGDRGDHCGPDRRLRPGFRRQHRGRVGEATVLVPSEVGVRVDRALSMIPPKAQLKQLEEVVGYEA